MKTIIISELGKIRFSSEERKSKAIAIINFMFDRLIEQGKPFDDYVDLPRNLLRRLCNKNYQRVIHEINDKLGIILPFRNHLGKESYSTKNGQPKSYKIDIAQVFRLSQVKNPSDFFCWDKLEGNEHPNKQIREYVLKELHRVLINNSSLGGSNINSGRICIASMCITHYQCASPPKTLELFAKNNINGLVYAPNELFQIVRDGIESADSDMKFEWPDTSGLINYRFTNSIGEQKSKYYTSKTMANAIALAEKSSKSLIEYKNKFYIADKQLFIESVKNKRLLAYTHTLRNFIIRNDTPKRSMTNHRLNSVITSMPNCMTNYLIEKNELCQIDLANSQFAIQAHLMKEEGVRDMDFEAAAGDGKLYEVMKSHFGVPDRTKMKQLAMIIQFSQNGTFREEKRMMRELFPVMCDFSEEKKKHDNSALALLLQRKEAEIFIDKIYKRLLNESIWSLTKHDSIICKKMDSQSVVDIINDEFDKIGFVGKLKIS